MNIASRAKQLSQKVAAIPKWAYFAVLGVLGLVAGLVYGFGVVLIWGALLAVLLAMSRAFVWAFKIIAFLLTAFMAVFLIIAVISGAVSLIR